MIKDGWQLNDLFRDYKSDKCELGYANFYASYFEKQGFDRHEVKYVLEIGTNKGSSLRAWAEYFTLAKVYGIDITTMYEDRSLLEHPRISTWIVDQGSREELELFLLKNAFCKEGKKFDLIIDDGSHDQFDQQLSLGVLFPNLRRGGLYVIEDLITGEDWWDGNTYNKKRVRPTRSLIQEFQQTGKFDSNILSDYERQLLEENAEYCHFHNTPQIIYGQHHPQIAFIGKK